MKSKQKEITENYTFQVEELSQPKMENGRLKKRQITDKN